MLDPHGKQLARYDRDCPVHGYEVLAEEDLTRDQARERFERGDYANILWTRRTR